jgi:hypothetical protein
MKTIGLLILGGACLLGGCGGSRGGSIGGSPNATLSATVLAFGGEAVGTTSPAQSITLSNYGTATLTGVSLAATADFAQTNTCGSTLVPGANCVITVTFTPSNTGDENGTISITDNATGSPQIVALTGSGTFRTGDTLTGYCIHGNTAPGPPFNPCASTSDPTECPSGQPAKNPGLIGCGPNWGPTFVDASSPCVVGSGRHASGGQCEVQVP